MAYRHLIRTSVSVRSAAGPHLGLIHPNYNSELSVDRLVGAAQAAEAAGFDSGWVTDHVLVSDEYAAYGSIARRRRGWSSASPCWSWRSGARSWR
jgi:alkanesulfonate monooxygenase SsuD/methylene tetrahydromethanopterin reductase-like flavin-dependent oxidoreductase (luciferase family)